MIPDHLTYENCKTLVRDAARKSIKDVPFLVAAVRDGWEIEEPFTHERYFARYDWEAEDFVIEKDVLMDHQKLSVSLLDDD